MKAPFLPAYGQGSLSDIMTSVGASLALPEWNNVLDLPAAQRWVVYLADGLGWEQLQTHIGELDQLKAMVRQNGKAITCGVPATTATSITSLGTALPPGEHGIAGYRFLLPEENTIFCPLAWDVAALPDIVQPRPSVFERLTAAGFASTMVAPSRFQDSGLTQAALRGNHFIGLPDEEDDQARLAAIIAAVERGPGVVYAYERHLDHTGHSSGVASWQWLDSLHRIDEFLGDLRAALPADVRLLVTGDHGMIDIPQQQRIVLEDDASLMAGLEHVAGEGRFRHLWTDEPEAVARRWQQVLGERAWIRTRQEAIAEGWFGDVSAPYQRRFGDVLVAMRDTWAVMTKTLPREFGLVGMHASLTPDEMLVPLLLD
ncbi:MAG: alkaline phosphatase family protein [Propionibacteriaceae bacterium]